MTQVIQTKLGDYHFEPVRLFHGRKKINKEISRENLLEIEECLSLSGIRWGLIYGTLLGAIRENDFINHDEDTDIFMFDEDRENFLQLLHYFRQAGFDVARYDTTILSLIRNDEYIDFYFFKNTPFGRRSGGYFIPKRFFKEFESVNFLGRIFPTIQNPKDFLEYVYGADWRTPKEGAHAVAKSPIWKRLIRRTCPICIYLYRVLKGDPLGRRNYKKK